MDDLNVHLRSVTRFIFFFLSFCLLTWALFPTARPIAAGLAVGALAGWVNAIYLFRKVKRIADSAAAQSYRRTNLGFLTRAAVAVLAVVIALRVPGINLYAVIAGYFVTQLATLLLGFLGIPRGKG
ncbi:ATP synthase subunit I [Paenibacillus alkalitolerans]|uniref:ATP synthase subunit I n=1 Tax=Paenibacillus alkalitolerans TaxID=2799335 RepID=UPI0018F57E86|nr:ATP synthase subunit I [Paenibacillus alkalitolerans]